MIVGGGPAALGMLSNAVKQGRIKSMLKDGIVVIEKGTSLGGGILQEYLINSNTSADGFLTCLQDNKRPEPARAKSKENKERVSYKKHRNSTLSPPK